MIRHIRNELATREEFGMVGNGKELKDDPKNAKRCVAWCGEDAGRLWFYNSIDHAVLAGMSEACEKCESAISDAMGIPTRFGPLAVSGEELDDIGRRNNVGRARSAVDGLEPDHSFRDRIRAARSRTLQHLVARCMRDLAEAAVPIRSVGHPSDADLRHLHAAAAQLAVELLRKCENSDPCRNLPRRDRDARDVRCRSDVERRGMRTVAQCKSCPWRVGCDPDAQIPGYNRELHNNLRGTIKSEMASLPGDTLRIMACHYSKTGEEHACAGWLHNQIGAGNNIAVRLGVLAGRLPIPEIDGEQHATFEDTLPKQKRRSRRP